MPLATVRTTIDAGGSRAEGARNCSRQNERKQVR